MMVRATRMTAFLAAAAILISPGVASATLLVNPDFDAGPVGPGIQGWTTFGNVFTEAVTPLSGTQTGKMFGNFSGGFNVSGMFQSFPASPGSSWQLSFASRHNTGDLIPGDGPNGPIPDDNWVVQKIVFKDAGNVEIGAVESIILDGSFAPDVWHMNAPITGVAPAGTVSVEAFALYLQPLFDGGAAFLDNAVFTPEPATLAVLGLGGLVVARRRRRHA